MKINKIEGKNIRVHDNFKFDLDPNLNVFFGKKRIGKTSLLYSIEMLFNNSNQLGRLIQHGKNNAEVTALIKPGKGKAKKITRRIGEKSEVLLSNEKTTVPKLLETFEVGEHFNKAFTPSKVFDMSKKDIRKIFMSGIDVPRELLDGPIENINSRITVQKDLIKKVKIEIESSQDTIKQAEMNIASKEDNEKAAEIQNTIISLEHITNQLQAESNENLENGKTVKRKLVSIESKLQELSSKKYPLIEEMGKLKGSAETLKRQATIIHEKNMCPTCHNKDIEGLKQHKKDQYSKCIDELKVISDKVFDIDKSIETYTSERKITADNLNSLSDEYKNKSRNIQENLKKINSLNNELKLYKNEAQNMAATLKKKYDDKVAEYDGLKKEMADLETEKLLLLETKIKDLEKILGEKYKTYFFNKVVFKLTKESKDGNISDDFRVEYDGTTYPDLSGSESIMAELEFSSMITDVVVIDQLERIGNLEDLDILRKFSKDTGVQIIGTWVGAAEGNEIELIN